MSRLGISRLRVVAARGPWRLLVELANQRDAVQVEFHARNGRVRAVSEPLFIPSWLARGYWTDTAGIPKRRLARAVAAARQAEQRRAASVWT